MGETLHNVGVSAVQILVVKFLKGTGGRRNGRIDGDIRQIKSSLCLLDDQRKAFESGYVGRHCNGLAALASYRFHGFVQSLLPPRDHPNPAAVAAQLLRNSTAHSMPTARNQTRKSARSGKRVAERFR